MQDSYCRCATCLNMLHTCFVLTCREHSDHAERSHARQPSRLGQRAHARKSVGTGQQTLWQLVKAGVWSICTVPLSGQQRHGSRYAADMEQCRDCSCFTLSRELTRFRCLQHDLHGEFQYLHYLHLTLFIIIIILLYCCYFQYHSVFSLVSLRQTRHCMVQCRCSKSCPKA